MAEDPELGVLNKMRVREGLHKVFLDRAKENSLLDMPPLEDTGPESRLRFAGRLEMKLRETQALFKKTDEVSDEEYDKWLAVAEATLLSRARTFLMDTCKATSKNWSSRFAEAAREVPTTIAELKSEMDTLFGEVDEQVVTLKELCRKRTEAENTLVYVQNYTTRLLRWMDTVVPDEAMASADVSSDPAIGGVDAAGARSGPVKAAIAMMKGAIGLQVLLMVIGDAQLVAAIHSKDVKTLPKLLRVLETDGELKKFKDRSLRKVNEKPPKQEQKASGADGTTPKANKKPHGRRGANGGAGGGGGGGGGAGDGGGAGKSKKTVCSYCSSNKLGTRWRHEEEKCKFKAAGVKNNDDLAAKFPGVWDEHQRLKKKKESGAGSEGGSVNTVVATASGGDSAVDEAAAADDCDDHVAAIQEKWSVVAARKPRR